MATATISSPNAAAVRLANLFSDRRIFSTLLVSLIGPPTVTGKRKKKVKPDYAHLAPFAALALTARPVAGALLRPDAPVWNWMWMVYLRHKSHRTLPMYAVLNACIRALPAYLDRRVPRGGCARKRITAFLEKTGNAQTTSWRQIGWSTYLEIQVYDALKELNSAEFDLASHDMETAEARDRRVFADMIHEKRLRRIHTLRLDALRRMETTLGAAEDVLTVPTSESAVVDGWFMWSRNGIKHGPHSSYEMRDRFNRGDLAGARIWVYGSRRRRRRKRRLDYYVERYGVDPFVNETALAIITDSLLLDAKAGAKARRDTFEMDAAGKRAALVARLEAARAALPLARERLRRHRRTVAGIRPYDVPALTKAFKKASRRVWRVAAS